jgi:hypothetical protein
LIGPTKDKWRDFKSKSFYRNLCDRNLDDNIEKNELIKKCCGALGKAKLIDLRSGVGP